MQTKRILGPLTGGTWWLYTRRTKFSGINQRKPWGTDHGFLLLLRRGGKEEPGSWRLQKMIRLTSLHFSKMIAAGASFLALWAVGNAAPNSISSLKFHVRNGTYVGVRNANYQQDFFLGMP
ncbi:uncharacterized protein ACLA_041480 [Aspergillus clavatus NRRL 1]|uniref:Uncharacterized protein n=1 Tax=Aspergillus clavatus (strain ATCC 1007 / CBS 513.65 / DSM 816 / NCTC 3887 / NRRL 1 / QM 1276 / 107) TaxID=344612 RepID=A1CLA6_ASPCL|nr:uncharacterized protein ACLA_041480 [Aspergillus clavatus NRRL 1]EAW09930.1 hypothetical protein ACLA_041480 [Aspergillus clavatus NRRL 1]